MMVTTVAARKGHGLVELLVVLGVIGVLAGLVLPAVQRARDVAARTACSNNLKQLGLAFHCYHDTQGALPPAYADLEIGEGAQLTWLVFLLPYLDQAPLWQRTLDAYAIESNPTRNPPHIGLATVIPCYICPTDARLLDPVTDDQGFTAAYTSYQGIAGGTTADGALRAQEGVRLAEITDGTSQTLLVGERPPPARLMAGAWYVQLMEPQWQGDAYGPRLAYETVVWDQDVGPCHGPFMFGPGQIDNPCDSNHFWSLHSGGANFLLVDGSVHFLVYAAAPIMPALATRAGGEAVEVP
jgi:prepilin-type processing-associated H-X9-DG protein/prepilin-type N-terminal cleavage/methylation domain-containing protein